MIEVMTAVMMLFSRKVPNGNGPLNRPL